MSSEGRKNGLFGLEISAIQLEEVQKSALIVETVLCHGLIINRDAESELLALSSNRSSLLSCNHADELYI